MLKVQPWAASDLNRWLNPWFSNPYAKAGLSGSGRLLRATLISARNLVFLLAAIAGLASVGKVLPAYVLIAAGLTATGTLAWQIRARDRREQEVSPALLLALFALVFAVMAAVRSMADQAGFDARYAYVIDLDESLFGGVVPSVWLQEHLHSAGSVSLLDAFASFVYFSYFTVPLLVAVALWHLNPRALRLYLSATILIIIAGNAWFTLLPTAPPWLAGQEGYLPQLARIAPEVMNHVRPGFYEQGYQAVGINEVAAFPSYHTAQTLLVALVGWRYRRWLGVAGLAYTVAMGFSLVYLGEHYVADVLAGVALAAVAWAAALRLMPAASRRGELVEAPAAAAEGVRRAA